MGYIPAEQTIAIIDAVKDKPNYWGELSIAVVVAIITILTPYIFKKAKCDIQKNKKEKRKRTG